MNIPDSVPCVTIKDRIVFPKIMIPIELDSIIHKELIQYLSKQNKSYLIVSENMIPGTVGTLCRFMQMDSNMSTKVRILVSGKYRVLLQHPLEINEMFMMSVIPALEKDKDDEISIQLIKDILKTFEKILIITRIPKETLLAIKSNQKNPGAICDLISSAIDIPTEKKYKILNSLSIRDRTINILKFLEEYLEILNTSRDIAKRTKENIDKRNKEYYLRSEIETIKKELGEDSNGKEEVKIYEEKLSEIDLPEEAKKEAMNELKRMKRMHPASHEYSIISTYLDWIIDLPWNNSTEDMLDIKKARKKLDDDHYGLEKPKKRILEYLAIRKLNPESRSPILCFNGPSGTGKTSICRSIADAMGRKFQRMSLGGVRDEAVIRGFKRTYVGSMPGRIIQAIKRAGTNNPVISLDEIDKLGSDHRGDPSSALLEALDPEQNYSFNDHYLNVAFDLSKVIFITTANLLETIPPALRDRMEVINFPGYSQYEKEKIAKDFLIPRQLKEHGLDKFDISFTKNSLDEIINGYTRESGVRNLEREIANVVRAIGCNYIENDELNKKVLKRDIQKHLGTPKFPKTDDIEISKPGVSIGMYYSSVGGGLFFFESVSKRLWGKKPELAVSGHLKDVMKESMIVAHEWVLSNKDIIYNITKKRCNIEHLDVHMHVPEGATPKDGPSGGAAIVVSLASLFSGLIPREKTAYTGEITLRGKILPVGGIKEKVIGAHRAGIKNIVMPSWCEKSLDKIQKDIRDDIKFYFVNTIEEVLKIAFGDTHVD